MYLIYNLGMETMNNNSIISRFDHDKSLRNRFRLMIYNLKRNKELILLALPGLTFLIVFNYLPMFGVVLAFKNYYPGKGFFGSPWVAFDNFKFFFTSSDAFVITRNTILMNLAFIVIGTFTAVAFGLMLFELNKRWTKIYQTILFFPYFTSWVFAAFLFYVFLNPDLGVLNRILAYFGNEPVLWYSEPKYWPFILIIVNVWKGVGYGSILYYTGLMGIDTSFYEAAEIDGATKLQQIRYISIPFILPLLCLLVMLSVGRIMNADFGLFFFVPQDSTMLYPVTDVMDTYVYRALRKTGDFGMGTAVGLYQSVVGFFLVLGTNYLLRRYQSESAVF